MKILRCAQDDSVGAWIGVILMGAACDFMPEVHADGALWGRARKGWFSGTGVRFSLGSCPKRVVFRYGGPVFYRVVPQKGGFQAPGSGFLWGRARKGCFPGTVQTPFCTVVPKCPAGGQGYAEVWKGSAQFCRTSVRNSGFMTKDN